MVSKRGVEKTEEAVALVLLFGVCARVGEGRPADYSSRDGRSDATKVKAEKVSDERLWRGRHL
jgi:hypothetical protein